ncbi:hypothetical protein [Microbulbifer sp. ARAS458-1]|uniref:hypothetical protein n=1 Tax=Microbulbifer sp. ARAS458-1 TaxID=3140242 RepID=UPI003877EE02
MTPSKLDSPKDKILHLTVDVKTRDTEVAEDGSVINAGLRPGLKLEGYEHLGTFISIVKECESSLGVNEQALIELNVVCPNEYVPLFTVGGRVSLHLAQYYIADGVVCQLDF